MKATVLLFVLLLSSVSLAQKKGRYRHDCILPRDTTSTIQDSLPTNGIPEIHRVFVVHNRWSRETLVIKWFGRFKIEGDGIITAYGLNTDNPTTYGRYRKKKDTLILTCRKSIQHFNSLAPKRRVKTKTNAVYRYIISEGKLETSEFCYWKLKSN